MDVRPIFNSDDFSDGPTTGSIVNPGDQILTVVDAADPADGLSISADAGGGATPATVSVIGGGGVLSLSPGDQVIVTFSSVGLEVIEGPVTVTLFGTGVEGIVTLLSGQGLIFDPTDNSVTAFPGQPDFTVSVGGVDIVVSAGQTEFLVPPDNTPPVIIPMGSNPVAVEFGNFYVDAGATASDDVDGDITGNIVTVNPVNTAVLDSYTVTYNVSDAAGNPATQVTRTVNVVDTTPPEITLVGSDSLDVEFGSTYIDAGATASDNVDGDITGNIVTVNPVNTAVLDSYTVTYDASDAAGNPATQVTRTINVVDTTPPIIFPPSDVTVEGNVLGGYSGGIGTATAIDGADPNPDISNNALAVFPLGNTTVVWTATDASGNSASANQIVTVEDTTPPAITLFGSNPANTEVLEPYTDAGATASDIVDGDVTGDIVVGGLPIDTSGLGSHAVTYDVADASGNAAVQVTRTVNVVDTTPPVLSVPAPITVEAEGPSGTPVTQSDVTDFLTGATATDNFDSAPVVTNDVTSSDFPLGATVVTFTATDAEGNFSADTSTVTVQDTTPPVITAPPDLTVVATGPLTLVDLGLPSVIDLVDQSPAVTNDAPPGGFPHGVTLVTWTATDFSGNPASATQTVTVLVPFDSVSIEEAEVELQPLALEDEVELEGRFLLGPDNIIDVPNQDVTIIFDGIAVIIPAGSFVRDEDNEGFVVEDLPGGIDEVKIWDDGSFEVEFEGVDLLLDGFTVPVEFTLQIGLNIGQFSIPLDSGGEFDLDGVGDDEDGENEDGDRDSDDDGNNSGSDSNDDEDGDDGDGGSDDDGNNSGSGSNDDEDGDGDDGDEVDGDADDDGYEDGDDGSDPPEPQFFGGVQGDNDVPDGTSGNGSGDGGDNGGSDSGTSGGSSGDGDDEDDDNNSGSGSGNGGDSGGGSSGSGSSGGGGSGAGGEDGDNNDNDGNNNDNNGDNSNTNSDDNDEGDNNSGSGSGNGGDNSGGDSGASGGSSGGDDGNNSGSTSSDDNDDDGGDDEGGDDDDDDEGSDDDD